MKGEIFMKNKKVYDLVLASILLAFTIVVQVLARNFNVVIPVLAGPFVNAVLIIGVYLCNATYGSLLAIVTPITAAATGQLAAPMVPFVPFIIIGNLLLIIPIAILKNKGKIYSYIGFFIGVIIKFLFLTFASRKLIYVFGMTFPKKVSVKLATIMSIPQLTTALIGGIIALIIIKLLKTRKAI